MSRPSTSRALVYLTVAMVQRMLREGLVLRSLGLPAVLTAGTLLMTLGVVAMTAEPTLVVAPADIMTAELIEELDARGLRGEAHADPRARVLAGQAGAGTDGKTLWVTTSGRSTLMAEAVLREHLGSTWRPVPGALASAPDVGGFGRTVSRLLASIFALYGVVFGAGMVARDRDDGTFEVELSLPTPRWVHGASRWLAGSLVLAGAVIFAIATFDALAKVSDVGAALRSAVAATTASTALGLVTVGEAGIRSGFAASLAFGLVATAALLGLGLAWPDVGAYLPLASVTASGDPDGWAPLALALLLGPLAILFFTRRSAHA